MSRWWKGINNKQLRKLSTLVLWNLIHFNLMIVVKNFKDECLKLIV
jgi:hypothetical protein